MAPAGVVNRKFIIYLKMFFLPISIAYCHSSYFNVRGEISPLHPALVIKICLLFYRHKPTTLQRVRLSFYSDLRSEKDKGGKNPLQVVKKTVIIGL